MVLWETCVPRAFDVHRSAPVCEGRGVFLNRSHAARVQSLQAQTRGCQETHSFIVPLWTSRQRQRPAETRMGFPQTPRGSVRTRQALGGGVILHQHNEATPSFFFFYIFKGKCLRRSRRASELRDAKRLSAFTIRCLEKLI